MNCVTITPPSNSFHRSVSVPFDNLGMLECLPCDELPQQSLDWGKCMTCKTCKAFNGILNNNCKSCGHAFSSHR